MGSVSPLRQSWTEIAWSAALALLLSIFSRKVRSLLEFVLAKQQTACAHLVTISFLFSYFDTTLHQDHRAAKAVPLLRAVELSCIRNERTLFADLSLTVEPGQIVQVAGPNGAGKSSLLRLLSGLAQPEHGQIRWRDQPLAHVLEDYRRELLYLGHLPGIKSELTPLENLAFYCPWTDEAQRFDVLERVNLVGYEDVPAGHLSAGQHRRVALARLWSSRQTLWILDEPLTAIDKQGVRELEQRFLQHTDAGGAIILTTHQDLSFAADRARVIRLDSWAE